MVEFDHFKSEAGFEEHFEILKEIEEYQMNTLNEAELIEDKKKEL